MIKLKRSKRSSGAIEPCLVCGRETAAGSHLHADRQWDEVIFGEGPADAGWLCRPCARQFNDSKPIDWGR
jgi:hypothetical protein